MKTIIQLLIAALVINACVQGGRSAWRHYQLKDAVQQEVRFGNNETLAELQSRLIEIGQQHGVTLDPADVQVERRGQQTRVALSYVEGIPVVPRAYTYQQKYELTFTETSMRLK